MSKSAVIASHTSSQRDTWWYLIQDDDGTLHVQIENTPTGEETTNHTVSINEFMKSGGAKKELQSLIDRMFEK